MSELILFSSGINGLAAPFTPETLPALAHTCAPGHVGEYPCLRRAAPELPSSVYVCGLCASSLDVAHALAARDLLPVWGSVLALGQTAGRGQLGRNWHSGAGNVFAALRLPPDEPFAGTAAAPALGALLAASLGDLGCRVLLKWPNDVLVPGPATCSPDAAVPPPPASLRKAGGILLEERHGRLLAGIGLNLTTPPPATALREGHALPGGCLVFPAARSAASDGASVSALSLWLELVTRIKFCYDQSAHSDSPGGFAARWRSLAESFLAYQGQEIGIVDGPDDTLRLRGVVSGLSPDGGLRVRAGGITHTVCSGSLIRL